MNSADPWPKGNLSARQVAILAAVIVPIIAAMSWTFFRGWPYVFGWPLVIATVNDPVLLHLLMVGLDLLFCLLALAAVGLVVLDAILYPARLRRFQLASLFRLVTAIAILLALWAIPVEVISWGLGEPDADSYPESVVMLDFTLRWQWKGIALPPVRLLLVFALFCLLQAGFRLLGRCGRSLSARLHRSAHS